MTPLALVVRGGLALHQPVETTDSFLPFLRAGGFAVETADTLDVYLDERLLRRTRVIVNCWTGGDLTADQAAGLDRAVRAGTGYAGWHGGVVAAFERREYHWITGGVFIGHPGDLVPHTLTVTRPDHPITGGHHDRGAEHRTLLGAHRPAQRRARDDHLPRRGAVA